MKYRNGEEVFSIFDEFFRSRLRIKKKGMNRVVVGEGVGGDVGLE